MVHELDKMSVMCFWKCFSNFSHFLHNSIHNFAFRRKLSLIWKMLKFEWKLQEHPFTVERIYLVSFVEFIIFMKKKFIADISIHFQQILAILLHSFPIFCAYELFSNKIEIVHRNTIFLKKIDSQPFYAIISSF